MTAELPDFDLEGFVPYRLAVVADQLSKELAAQYKERFGISIAEWRVLVNVGYSPDTSVRDIERRVSLEKSKASRAATRLEQAGYLSKSMDPDDGRLIRLALTEEGALLLSEIVPLAKAYQAKVEALLGGEFAGLQAALERLMGDE